MKVLRILWIVNIVLIIGCFVRAYLLDSDIKAKQQEAQIFAQHNRVLDTDRLKIETDDGLPIKPIPTEDWDKWSNDMDRYLVIVMELHELRNQQSSMILYGQMGFVGLVLLSAISYTVAQRKRDSHKITDATIDSITDEVFVTPSDKKGKVKSIGFSTENGKIYFDGFALLKGFVLSQKESEFEVPYDSIIDCFIQPLKHGRHTLICVTTQGRIDIPDTISEPQKLYEFFKVLAANTPEAKIYQKPWFQGIMIGVTVPIGLVVVFGIWFYFWG